MIREDWLLVYRVSGPEITSPDEWTVRKATEDEIERIYNRYKESFLPDGFLFDEGTEPMWMDLMAYRSGDLVFDDRRTYALAEALLASRWSDDLDTIDGLAELLGFRRELEFYAQERVRRV
jgi:hypothetical protein